MSCCMVNAASVRDLFSPMGKNNGSVVAAGASVTYLLWHHWLGWDQTNNKLEKFPPETAAAEHHFLP